MNKNAFISNRKRIADLMKNNSVLVLFNKPVIEANKRGSIDNNFYYTTGNSEIDNIIVISKMDNKILEVMFIKQYDELVAKWEGAFLSKEEVTSQTGISDVRYVDTFDSYLSSLLAKSNDIYFDIPITRKLKNYLTFIDIFVNEFKTKHQETNILNASEIFKTVRMVKSKEEIDIMKESINITKNGIENMLKNVKVGMYEYQVESFFDQVIKYNNATHAFTTIAATGKNACCLHYSDNNTKLNNGELMLLDLGSSFNNYKSDISRTFPVDGKFSPRQKILYNIVLNGQLEAIKYIRPGVTLNQINDQLLNYYEVELKKINLIENRDEINKYYFHRISHHIGLDTHDLSHYETPLEEGMVITCEPGLYIEEENIGIRIEDDLLITKDGNINLSSGIIKTVEEIENFMNNKT